jgi:hypothetical protein
VRSRRERLSNPCGHGVSGCPIRAVTAWAAVRSLRSRRGRLSSPRGHGVGGGPIRTVTRLSNPCGHGMSGFSAPAPSPCPCRRHWMRLCLCPLSIRPPSPAHAISVAQSLRPRLSPSVPQPASLSTLNSRPPVRVITGQSGADSTALLRHHPPPLHACLPVPCAPRPPCLSTGIRSCSGNGSAPPLHPTPPHPTLSPLACSYRG